MSNYTSIKATINANIKANGNQEITGPVLQSVLNAMVDTLGGGYGYAGIATPSTNPGSPDNKVFYIASSQGTYSYYGGIVVNEGEVVILKWDTAWHKDVVGAATAEQVAQISHAVNGYDRDIENVQSLDNPNKFYNLSLTTLAAYPNGDLTGCYCTRIAVTPGQRYRVKGKQSSANAYRLWATANSSRARQRVASTGSNTRTQVDITIESGESFLYVNLVDYDSSQDGVFLITTEYVPGLVERFDALDLEVNGITTELPVDQAILTDKFVNTGLASIPTKTNLPSLSGTSCVYLNVSPGEKYRIYGYGNAANVQLYVLADASRNIVTKPGVAMNTRSNGFDITIPEGIAYLVVNLYQYASTDKVQKITYVTTTCIKSRLADLEEQRASIQPLSGKKIMFFGDSITEFKYDDKGVVDYFTELSGATCYNAAVGGTRLAQRATPVDTPSTSTQAYAALDICNMVKAWATNTYTQQDAAAAYLSRYASSVSAMRNNPIGGVDVVIIGGGTNDITGNSTIGAEGDTSLSTIWGAMNEITRMLLAANPALKIYFFSPVVGYNGSTRNDANWCDNYINTSGMKKPEYIALFESMAHKSHIPYIDLYTALGWNQTNFSQYFLDSDNTHPYKGFDVIARRVYHQLVSLME